LGWWQPGAAALLGDTGGLVRAFATVNTPLALVEHRGALNAGLGGTAIIGDGRRPRGALPLLALVPRLCPHQLGAPDFRADYSLRYAYLIGPMAHGIASVELVKAAANGGLLAFFGAAGLSVQEVEAAIDRLQRELSEAPFGVNLIHSPADPALEQAVVDLFLRRGVTLVDASAYLRVSAPLVKYRATGMHRDAQGRVVCPNRILAKVSRVEVARKFLQPPPARILAELTATGHIRAEEAELAATLPLASDLTAEADSGGHTDNRPAISLLPAMIALRDEMVARYGYARPPRVGLGGGIATPASVAAAFAMGAAFVMTGTINQACIESGTSGVVRQMLAEAGQADVTMAPSADMFEMGVRVQVLKRGTLFAQRAARLYELYRNYGQWSEIPAEQGAIVERDVWRRSFAQEWESTRAYFQHRDPRQIALAESNPHHQLALVFRSYLGQSALWAQQGIPERQIDYQVWCGPAMGAFNEWARGSFLEQAANRRSVEVALNLLLGACMLMRRNAALQQGIDLPAGVGHFRPLPLDDIQALLADTPAAERDSVARGS
jgi:PfaD family protein